MEVKPDKNFNFAEWMSGQARNKSPTKSEAGKREQGERMAGDESSNRSPGAAFPRMNSSSPSGLRAVRSSKMRFSDMEDAATRVRRYLMGELGQGVADVILQFEDERRIYIAKHYMVAISSVWDGLLNEHDKEEVFQKPSRTKDGTRQRVFLIPEKSFEDVLEFWCICYCSDDAVMTVTEANLQRMLELAAEWKVFPMLCKCERLICKMIAALRDLPVWKALCQGSTACGCSGPQQTGIEDCEECGLPFHLRMLAWIAVIATENKLAKSWNAVLTAFRDLPINTLTALLDEHPEFEDVGLQTRFAIMVHYITDHPDGAAAASAMMQQPQMAAAAAAMYGGGGAAVGGQGAFKS